MAFACRNRYRRKSASLSNLLIPILAIFLTLFPLSLFMQSQFGMLLPQAIMAVFAPIISASDSLPAILIAVLLCHLLWFAGIHGAVIVGGILQAFWLTNLGIDQEAFNAGAPITKIFIEPFWQFFITVGDGGDHGAGLSLSAQPFCSSALYRQVGRGAEHVQHQ
nr:PTS transporter subunit EIIC [Pectobacterium colocasium]